jgi:hypothetical protein
MFQLGCAYLGERDQCACQACANVCSHHHGYGHSDVKDWKKDEMAFNVLRWHFNDLSMMATNNGNGIRVTRWVCEKMAQNVAQAIFRQSQ